MYVRTVLATLVAVVLLVSAQPAQALQVSMGQISLETFILDEGVPEFPDTYTMGTNALSLTNNTGENSGEGLYPRILTPVVISKMVFTCFGSGGAQTFDLGTETAGPGILQLAMLFPSIQFPSNQTFSSITFSGEINIAALDFGDGSRFIADPLSVTAILVPLYGEIKINTFQLAEIFIEGDYVFAAVPEPSTFCLLALGGIFLLRRKKRI